MSTKWEKQHFLLQFHMVKSLHSTNSDLLCSLIRMPLGRENIVKTLIKNGAKIDFKDKNGKIAIEIGEANGKTKNRILLFCHSP